MKTSVSEVLHGITDAVLRHIPSAPRHAGKSKSGIEGREPLQLALNGYPNRY
jgi:hypothetical protein